MSRIFWDSMLLIYVVDGNPKYIKRCIQLLQRSRERGDTLTTSYLALGEVLSGAKGSEKALRVREMIDAMEFSYLPFEDRAVSTFATLRGKNRLKQADAINLACAAAAGTDLFLTGDKQLMGLHVPGIHFISDFETQLL